MITFLKIKKQGKWRIRNFTRNLQICEPRSILFSESDAIYSPEMTYFVFKHANALQMLI